MCDALVNDMSRGRSFSGLRGNVRTSYPLKKCSRSGVHRCGDLLLCNKHEAMCHEGLVMSNGQVYPSADIRNSRKYGMVLETWYRREKSS